MTKSYEKVKKLFIFDFQNSLCKAVTAKVSKNQRKETKYNTRITYVQSHIGHILFLYGKQQQNYLWLPYIFETSQICDHL